MKEYLLVKFIFQNMHFCSKSLDIESEMDQECNVLFENGNWKSEYLKSRYNDVVTSTIFAEDCIKDMEHVTIENVFYYRKGDSILIDYKSLEADERNKVNEDENSL